MKKQFTLGAIGLLAVTMLLFAGAFLTGRYDEPTADNLGVERLSTPLSQLESENAQGAPILQPKEKPPTAEPADPLREPPRTSLDSTPEPLNPPAEPPQSSLDSTAEPLDPPGEPPQVSLDSTREVEVDFR